MIVIQRNSNVEAILEMYARVAAGSETTARGMSTRNVHNLAIVLDAAEPVITNFKHRKMNLAYAKREWLWYLGADPKDDSICKHASAWAKLRQADGSFYSNYGQYLFGQRVGTSYVPSQFQYVLHTLATDPQSRRASIMLLKAEHLYPDNTDTVCTYAINLTINHDHLDMTVMMRSNDVIWGFTNDAFCFWNLYHLVYAVLKGTMHDLQIGTYTHMTNSMHVYDRHYTMIGDIIADPEFTQVTMPLPTAYEALQLVFSQGKDGAGEYSNWLKTFD